MGKALIVFDEMPATCVDCVACEETEKISLGDYKYKQLYRCNFIGWNNKDIENYLPDILNTKPKWCPLKEMPTKDNIWGHGLDWIRGYYKGFDDCVKTITD